MLTGGGKSTNLEAHSVVAAEVGEMTPIQETVPIRNWPAS